MLALSFMNAIADSVSLTLACHPETPSRAIQGIEALVGTAPGHILTLAFTLEGDIASLRIPEHGPCRRAGGLWRHTCFEVFAMPEGGPGYREFNFSPSGEWAAYAFRGYREGGEPGVEFNPGIVVRKSMNRLELDAEICRDSLPPGSAQRLGLSAVVEDADGLLSYWALQHPPGKPDFHHTDAFALQLVLP
jgi:hypothetical protein